VLVGHSVVKPDPSIRSSKKVPLFEQRWGTRCLLNVSEKRNFGATLFSQPTFFRGKLRAVFFIGIGRKLPFSTLDKPLKSSFSALVG
jgi:hypothetical protein